MKHFRVESYQTKALKRTRWAVVAFSDSSPGATRQVISRHDSQDAARSAAAALAFEDRLPNRPDDKA
ncbi:hypothetical protein LCL99_03855 [Halomonas denitrificans]|uniref:hypothetical protein n=1 Tax=Halomonas TaxID=2745 RepID=UPI001C9556B0|nr:MULTISPECIES: hypothetical protein [Halomonas]MBY6029676.1 hypothetical protein [Halomonas sp. DP8Y7-1]MCA0973593.1 hypothetical protein [Halomonas denitrificans]